MTETQNGFWKGRSYTDHTFYRKVLTEKQTEYNLDTQWLFIVEKHLTVYRDWFWYFGFYWERESEHLHHQQQQQQQQQQRCNSGHTQNKILIKSNSKLSKLNEINKAVCHNCPLLPRLYYVSYLFETVTKWQKENKRNSTSRKPTTVNAVTASDQVIITKTADKITCRKLHIK